MLHSSKTLSIYLSLSILLAFAVPLHPAQASEIQPFLIKDVFPGPFALLYQQVIFVGDDGIHGNELWTSDGSPQGTHLVKDIHPGPGGINADLGRTTVFNGSLYFVLGMEDIGPHGDQLWRTDGTETGTQLVKNFEIGGLYPGAQGFTVFHGAVYFVTLYSSGSRVILWKTDGSEAGTLEVKSFPLGVFKVDKAQLTILGDRLLIDLSYIGQPTYPNYFEYWSSDGSGKGTTRFFEVDAANDSCPDWHPVQVGARVFFCLTKAFEYAEVLFQTDGSAPGTQMVYQEGQTAWPDGIAEPVVVNDTLYFQGHHDISNNYGLWKVSPGSDAAIQVKAFGLKPADGPTMLVAGQDVVFFYANDGTSGQTAWRSDGTPTGTLPLNPPATPYTLIPGKGCAFDGRFFFMATDPTHVLGFWGSDGSLENTRLIAVIPGVGNDNPFLTATRDTLFFRAWGGARPMSLWGYQPHGLLNKNFYLPNITH